MVRTYNSTITIESLYLGTNAINAGYAHFSRIDYFKIAKSKEEYLNKIENFLENKTISNETVDIVSSYLYQLIFNSSIDLSSQVNSLDKYEYYIKKDNFKNSGIESFVKQLEDSIKKRDI